MSEPEIIYEDKNFLAIDKPAGLQVHAARHRGIILGGDKEAVLTDWLLRKYPEVKSVGDDPTTRPGIVHRLDKGTSGVMLVARNQEYFEYLKQLFQKHEVKKIYLALVYGSVVTGAGTVKKPIGIKSGTLKRSVHSPKMAKEAETAYRVIKRFKDTEGHQFSLLEVEPKTGRTHQIRVHLASIDHPVAGDKLYGPRKSLNSQFSIPNPRLMLHALSLEFTAEDGRRVKIESEPPPEFMKIAGVVGRAPN